MAPPSSSDVEHLFSAEGLVAVVTGGGTGIGLMIATALENNGATVYIVGRRKDVLEKAAKENAKHGKIIPIQGDVTSVDSLLSVASTVESRTGYINLLVNNSGIFGPSNKFPQSVSADNIKELQKVLLAADPEEFQQTFKVNVTAVYYTTAVFLELLHKGNRHGIPGVTSQVITVASVAGFRRESKPAGIAYCTSKAATILFGKMLANMLKDCRIRSNIIAPGIYPSEMSLAHGLSDDIPADVIPMRRAGTKDDMSGLILFLATKAGAYVNGDVAVTDGGRLGIFPATY